MLTSIIYVQPAARRRSAAARRDRTCRCPFSVADPKKYSGQDSFTPPAVPSCKRIKRPLRAGWPSRVLRRQLRGLRRHVCPHVRLRPRRIPHGAPAISSLHLPLLVGGAGSLRAPGRRNATIIDDPRYVSDVWRKIAQACADQLDVCRSETVVDWVYLSPPALIVPGHRTGSFRVGKDDLLVDAQGNSQISFEDLAVAVLDEAEQPRHHRARFTVAY